MTDDDPEPRPTSPQIGGGLYRLLCKGFPTWRSARGRRGLDVHRIAAEFGFSHEAIYKWLRADHIPARHATRLIKLSEGRLTEADFFPFVFKE